MTGPGARLDAENDNLQAYCDRLEAENADLLSRHDALKQRLRLLEAHRAADVQRITELEQVRDQYADALTAKGIACDTLTRRLGEALRHRVAQIDD